LEICESIIRNLQDAAETTQISTVIEPSDQPLLLTIAIRVGLALLILLLAKWFARFVSRWLTHLLARTTLTSSMVLVLTKLAFYGTWVLAVLVALTFIGVPITGVVAALGAIGLILGIALQESIGNFASAVIFFLFQPFKVGDLIETGDVIGIVTEIQPFHTVITKYDKKVITIPNSKIERDSIINYSTTGILRADQLFQISYSDDLEHALAILQEIVTADERVLADPPPIINVRELGSSGVTIAVLPHVNFENFWPIQADLRKAVKLRFDQEGIVIPFPQRVVHIEHEPQPEEAAG